MNEGLFDDFEYKPPPKEVKKIPIGASCNKCIFCYCIEYRSGRRFYYCSLYPDNRTDCKMKKVKARGVCEKFEVEASDE